MTTQLNPIKTFVLRQGHFSRAQKQAIATLMPKFGLQLAEGLINFSEIFQNENPVFIEIGFGMGTSLLQLCLEHPEHNYIGIEVHGPGVGTLLAASEKAGIKNLRIYHDNALQVLQQCIPDHTVQGFLIFFPDPWPKKRHHKRRIIQANTVELLSQKLRPHGTVHLATDIENYAEQMQQVFAENPKFTKMDLERYRPKTKFEEKGLVKGHQIFDLYFNLTT